MKNKHSLVSILLLFLLVLGLTSPSLTVFADKKATEGQNEADVEFYKPTPKKTDEKLPETKKTESKILSPVTRLLPKTGENQISTNLKLVGMVIVFLMGLITFKFNRVGDRDEN